MASVYELNHELDPALKPLDKDEKRASEEGKNYVKEKTTAKTAVDTRMTLSDIGIFMSKRMQESVNKKQHANDNLLEGSLPYHANQFDSITQMKSLLSSGSSSGQIEALGIDRRGFETTKDGSGIDNFTLSIGEADVMNIPFQFNELDDVRSNLNYPYIGRLYGERIYTYNMPKVLFQVGQMKTRLTAFAFLNGLDASNDMSTYLRSGGSNSLAWGISRLKMACTAGISWVTKGFLGSKNLYEFKPSPRVYVRYVNEILQELAVYMDLSKSPMEKADYCALDDSGEEDGALSAKLNKKLKSSDYDEDMMADGMQESHYMGKITTLHVYKILPSYVRNFVKKKHNGENDWSDFNKMANKAGSVIGDFVGDTMEIAKLLQALYIPFMLQRGVSVSESFTNSTGEHPLVGQINSVSLDSQQQELAKGMDTQTPTAVASALMSGDTSAAFGALAGKLGADTLRTIGGKGGEMGIILSGNSRFTFPEVWNDSTFDRSYSLTFKLYTPYGDRLSVFENVYVPFIMLLCMALPRQIGGASYMSPFMIRAFAKGLFSCDLGIISSLSVTKGEDANDKTFEGFPRSLTISMSIKDLAPKLTMSLDGGIFGLLSAKNVGFRGYLMNMANIGIEDRVLMLGRIQDVAKMFTGKFNWENFGMLMRTNIASSFPFQIAASFSKTFLEGSTTRASRSRDNAKIY